MQEEECLLILRRFMADAGDVQNGIRLVNAEKQIASFLESKMDRLAPEERYKVYGFMEGMFPHSFKRILAIRLREETDARCMEIVQAISRLHSGEM